MKLNRVRHRRRDLLKIDRLIELPNDVLLNILERVGTLEAIRTCVVSKRTQHLPAMLSQIVIVHSVREVNLHNGYIAQLTEKILTTRSPQIPLHKLKLRFMMRGDDHLKIGRSVARAMASQEIDAAEFEVLTKQPFHGDQPDPVYYAKQFNDFTGECPGAFAGLTRLSLQNLRFGDVSEISNILITCKQLQSLCFFRCDAATSASVLHVEHDRLIELDISFGNFLRVALTCLPKLQRIRYNTWLYGTDPFVLGSVPQLSKITLSCAYGRFVTHRLSEMLLTVPSIDNLQLDFQSGKIWIQPESQKLLAPLLRQLRLVNLDNLPEDCDIAWTMFFLEAAASLQELCITVWGHNCDDIKSQKSHSVKTYVKWEPSVANFKHKNLSKLTIHGFQSDDNFTRYVRGILKVAVNIKEVSLHDRKVCKVCTKNLSHLEVSSSRYPQSIDEEDSLRRKMTEELVAASPAVIHFRP